MSALPTSLRLLSLLLCALPAAANGAAYFDGFVESIQGTTLVDGGITFSNMDNGHSPPPAYFSIENGSASFGWIPGFTPPNALGFSGISPGPYAGFGRVVRFEFSSGVVENSVSLDLYVAGMLGVDTVTLEGWLGSTLAGSSSFPLPTDFGIVQASMSGFAFDRVVVHGGGPNQSYGFLACVDNVLLGPPPAPGASFCAGDGLDPAVTTPCPCGNAGAAGNGCANSVNAAGAMLATTGLVVLDSVVLHGSGMPATASCIYLQGDTLDDAVFGDGVRCAGGALLRLRTRANVGGASQFPDSTDTITLSQRVGLTIGSGAVRYYQTYYRNSAALFCPPKTFNVTNGQRIVW